MSSFINVSGLAIKCATLLVNIIILALYRWGGNSVNGFLGINGYNNINGFSQHDYAVYPISETLASGVIVGFLIYNLAVLVSYLFGEVNRERTLMEAIMLFIGMFLFFIIGGIALGNWLSNLTDSGMFPYYSYRHESAGSGIWLGILLILQGLLYLVDLILTSYSGMKDMLDP